MSAPTLTPSAPVTPGSPPAASPPARRVTAPRWSDARLITGVVLVLLCVVIGVRVVAAADDRVDMWAVTADLAAGTVLSATDVRAVPVLVDSPTRYVPAGESPVGRTLGRAVGSGELLPAGALLGVGERRDRRQVAIPVDADRVPLGLSRGDVVDLWSTTEIRGEVSGSPARVLSGATVVAVPTDEDLVGTSRTTVVVDVADADVAAVVAALRGGTVDLVRVGTA